MGFLQILRSAKEKKSLGVCVPEAYRKRHAAVVEDKPLSMADAFKVEGIFAVHGSIMLQGKMVQGMLRVGREIKLDGKKMKVLDISVERKPAERIEQGQRGALFLQAKSFPIIRAGDLLEF